MEWCPLSAFSGRTVHPDVRDARVVEHGAGALIPGVFVEAARRDLGVQGEEPRPALPRLVLEKPEQRGSDAVPARLVHHRHPPDARDARLDEDESTRPGGYAVE